MKWRRHQRNEWIFDGDYQTMKLMNMRKHKILPMLPWAILIAGFVVYFSLYFGAVIFKGGLLAPGDGINYYYPNSIRQSVGIWSDLLLSGFPVIGDPQAQIFYLPRLLSWDYNALVISAYLIMAIGMFGMTLRLTGSRWAALTASVVASSSGFMMAHLGHLSIIHAAAWTPCLLWAVAAQRARSDWRPVSAGAISVAMCLLAGHPQISIYCLLLAAAYAVFEWLLLWREHGRAKASKFGLKISAIFLLGVLLSLVSMLPFVGAANESVRSNWSIADFDSYSHTFHSLKILIFPYLLGGNNALYGGYHGPLNLTELTIYVGILPLFLTVAGLLIWRNDKRPWFWLISGVIALILTLGSRTPLGSLLFHTPGLGSFRAQARFGILSTLSVSILSAYGVAGVLRAPVARARILQVLAICIGAFLLVAGSVMHGYPKLVNSATALHIAMPPIIRNPAVLIPFALIVFSTAIFTFFAIRRSRLTSFFLLVLTILDLGSFGYFYEWHYNTVQRDSLSLPPEVDAVVSQIKSGGGRLLPLRLSDMGETPFTPNLSMAYGIPSAVAYGPLLPARQAMYTGVDTGGNMKLQDANAPLMNVLGVQWLAVPRIARTVVQPQSLGQCEGSGGQRGMIVRLPASVTRGQIRIVSQMGCSQAIQNGSAVGYVQFLDSKMSIVDQVPLRAGYDTSEWAYDRSDVNKLIQHQRAPIAESFAAEGFEGHWYETQKPLPPGSGAQTIRVELNGAFNAGLAIKSIELVGSDGTKTSLAAGANLVDPGHDGSTLDVAGLPLLYKRAGFESLAWDVCQVQQITSDRLTEVLNGDDDLDGYRFDPYKTALIETGVGLPPVDCHGRSELKVIGRHPGRWELKSTSSGHTLVVVSDSYSRGWRAKVDGIQQSVIPVDGLILGVAVGPGTHDIELDFLPCSFVIGASLSALGLLLCLWAAWPSGFRFRHNQASQGAAERSFIT